MNGWKVKTVKYLLQNGANINHFQKKSKDNALSSAIYFGEYEIAKFLMDKGLTLTEEMKERDEGSVNTNEEEKRGWVRDRDT